MWKKYSKSFVENNKHIRLIKPSHDRVKPHIRLCGILQILDLVEWNTYKFFDKELKGFSKCLIFNLSKKISILLGGWIGLLRKGFLVFFWKILLESVIFTVKELMGLVYFLCQLNLKNEGYNWYFISTRVGETKTKM